MKQKLYCASNLKCTNVKIDCVNLSLTAGDANGWSAYERKMNSLSRGLFVQTSYRCKMSQISRKFMCE